MQSDIVCQMFLASIEPCAKAPVLCRVRIDTRAFCIIPYVLIQACLIQKSILPF